MSDKPKNDSDKDISDHKADTSTEATEVAANASAPQKPRPDDIGETTGQSIPEDPGAPIAASAQNADADAGDGLKETPDAPLESDVDDASPPNTPRPESADGEHDVESAQRNDAKSPSETDDKADATTPSDAEPPVDNTETTAPVAAPHNTSGTHTKRPNRKGLWVLAVLLVLGWGITGAAGYWGYQQAMRYQNQSADNQGAIEQLKNELTAQINTGQQAQVEQLKRFQQTVDGEFKALSRESTSQLQKLLSQLEEHEARLNGQQERLTGLSTTSREDWLLAEAEYLLKLANQRVLMERTPANAVALLTRADTIIERVGAGLGDRELFAIRKLLAQEITALKLVEPVDSQGIYLQLGSLAEAIEQLPTLPGQEERFRNSKAAEPMRETTWAAFKREMSNVFDFLRNSFDIRSADDELVNPIVSQQHLQLMQLNTRLLLEQAQISLLKEESVSYKESLKAASSLVNQYYFESPKRAAFSEDIIALAQKDIAPTLPDISKSLKLLHSYIADQHRLNAPSAGQINGEGA
ncbi:MAG TPA: uroporphyrinogen-III C-methyltransferase, partial [Marinagarivorans sp.]